MPRTPQSKLFPNPQMNFTAGRYMPPSNNTAAQPSLFQRGDPYARNQPFSVRQALGSGGIPGASPSLLANSTAPGPQALGGELPGSIPIESQVERILGASAGLMPGPSGEPTPTSLDALRLLQEQKFGIDPSTPVSPTDGGPTVAASDLALAARALQPGVENNPFITPEGKKALARGGVPSFNQINPAFYRYSSPTVVQALQALYPMTQLFGPQDASFFANLFTPRGL